MHLWHLTQDAPRNPQCVTSGDVVTLHIGTWPAAPDQRVWVTCHTAHADGMHEQARVEAVWQRNEGPNSYWSANVGPFRRGDHVRYDVHGRTPEGEVSGPTASFRVDPGIFLALLWHLHQPVYKDTAHPAARGS